MTELALDHDQRNALVGHLNRVGMPQLMWREPTPNSSSSSGVMQLLARGRRFLAPAGGRAMDHAQERSNWELLAEFEPWVELFPRPAIHPDLSSLSAFPVPDEHGTAVAVKIALLEGECFADPSSGTPQ